MAREDEAADEAHGAEECQHDGYGVVAEAGDARQEGFYVAVCGEVSRYGHECEQVDSPQGGCLDQCREFAQREVIVRGALFEHCGQKSQYTECDGGDDEERDAPSYGYAYCAAEGQAYDQRDG